MGVFTGKVAFVTGATSGIGRATALAFAQAGASVIAAGRRAPEGEAVLALLRQEGGDALFLQLDVTEEAAVAAAIETVLSHFGRLDYAVNSAAIDAVAKLADCTAAEYHRVFDTNVKGLVLCLRHEILAMRQGAAQSSISVRCLPRRPWPGRDFTVPTRVRCACSLILRRWKKPCMDPHQRIGTRPDRYTYVAWLPAASRGCGMDGGSREGDEPAPPDRYAGGRGQCGPVPLFAAGCLHHRCLPRRRWRVPPHLKRGSPRILGRHGPSWTLADSLRRAAH